MLDLTLFGNPVFTLNLLMSFISFIVIAGNIVMPFFLELVKGYRTEQVGLLMMVVPVIMGLVSPISGTLSDRFGSRGISLLGLLVIIVGYLSIASVDADVGFVGFVIRLIPLGLGFGLFQSPNNSAVMGAVPKYRLGVASGLLTLSRTMGHSSGLPLMGAIFNAITLSAAGLEPSAKVITAPASALISGFSGTYIIGAGITGISVVMAVAAWRLSRSRVQEVDYQ
jgi:MFS family permease